jgi:alkylhydroperoxidase family enzyme
MIRSTFDSARVAPAQPPLDDDVQAAIDAVMRGNPPLVLFTTMARDRRLFLKYFSGGLLDRGHLTPRQREVVIDRTTALCGAEYEWGVHITQFAEWAGLTDEQVRSLANGNAFDSCWNARDRDLIELCDALHDTATVDDDLWLRLRETFTEEAMIELLLLVGFYHSTSFLVNALRLPLEPNAARFAEFGRS